MKKVVSIILALILSFSLSISTFAVSGSGSSTYRGKSSANSEESESTSTSTIMPDTPAATSDKPILFRDIPWGTSLAEYVEIMEEQGIGTWISDEYKCYSWEFKPSKGELKEAGGMNGVGYTCSSSNPNITVAGFKIGDIDAYFLYSFDEENVYTDKERSSLYRADYEFDVFDAAATYEVLKSKLSSLYGEGESDTISTSWWSTGGDYHEYSEWTVWYGQDDTGVVLWRNYGIYDEDGSVKKDKIRLQYGKTNSLTAMSALEAAQAREEIKKAMNSSDVSGL